MRQLDRVTVSVVPARWFRIAVIKRLHCFDAVTGDRCWVHPLESKVWCASTLVADGKVYAGTVPRQGRKGSNSHGEKAGREGSDPQQDFG